MRVVFATYVKPLLNCTLPLFPYEVESSLIDGCLEATIDQYLVKSRNGRYTGELLIGVKRDRRLTYYGRVYLTKLPAGSRFKVHKVIKGSDGSWGSFLRVQVKLMDSPFRGTIADIPACMPSHPAPEWVASCSLDPKKIVFKEIIKRCE